MRFSRWSLLPLPALVLTLFLAAPVAELRAQTQTAAQIPPAWSDAVARLASRIGSIAGSKGTISVAVKNVSSLQGADVAAISQALKSELERLHFSVNGDFFAQTSAAITLSEGAEGYIWVAEVHNADSERLVIVPVGKVNSTTSGPVPAIARNIVWEQSGPFFDFEWHETAGGVSTSTTILESAYLTQQVGQSSPTPLRDLLQRTVSFKISRDLRGEILSDVEGDKRIMLSGSLCVSSMCGDRAGEVWPLGSGIGGHYMAGKNYFTGLDLGEGMEKINQVPFYSAAFLDLDHGEYWITAELDGKARRYSDRSNSADAVFFGWGDDIATIKTGCNNEWQVLVTGTGDWTQPDQIQIYEIRDRQAIKVGQPLDFPGPILALWPANDMRSARVVSRNLQTGMYEASIVSVTCSE